MNQKISLKGQAAISKVIDSTESFFDKRAGEKALRTTRQLYISTDQLFASCCLYLSANNTWLATSKKLFPSQKLTEL